jgi:ABC-2 type transport system permease protein
MAQIPHILKYKLICLISFFRQADLDRRLRGVVGIFVMLLFFVGGLYFFWYVFTYLSRVQEIGFMLMDKIVSLGFLAIFVMLIVSNIVTAISTLYRSSETAFYFSLPVDYIKVFTVRFIDNLAYSTWGVLILGLPFVFAYGIVRDFAWWHYIFVFFLLLIPFTIIPACLGVALIIVIHLLSKYLHPKSILTASLALITLAVVIYIKFGQPSSMTHNVMADWRVLNSFLGSMSATSFPFLPNYWVTETLRYFAGAIKMKPWIYVLALLSTTAFLMRYLFLLAEAYYHKSWQASVELGVTAKKKSHKSWELPAFFGLPNWLPSDFRSVLTKDLKLFIREPAQWAQFLVLLVLLVIYLLNLRHFPGNITDKFWRTIISFANFAFTGFILATLSVRFVYPNISLEGKSFWTIASSPMSLKRLFWEKFFLAFIIFVLLAEVLAFISNLMLGLTGFMMILGFFSILLMSISLTSLSVGLGAAFPSFEERNPGRIASSVGGIITTVISLVYVCLMVIILALPTHRYSVYVVDGNIPFPQNEFLTAAVLILILNLLTVIIPIRIGLKSLNSRDF